jgi:hypothetical protein
MEQAKPGQAIEIARSESWPPNANDTTWMEEHLYVGCPGQSTWSRRQHLPVMAAKTICTRNLVRAAHPAIEYVGLLVRFSSVPHWHIKTLC